MMSDTVYTTPAPDGRIAVIAHDEETGFAALSISWSRSPVFSE
jgi:hypothetical protein